MTFTLDDIRHLPDLDLTTDRPPLRVVERARIKLKTGYENQIAILGKARLGRFEQAIVLSLNVKDGIGYDAIAILCSRVAEYSL